MLLQSKFNELLATLSFGLKKEFFTKEIWFPALTDVLAGDKNGIDFLLDETGDSEHASSKGIKLLLDLFEKIPELYFARSQSAVFDWPFSPQFVI